MRKAVMLAVALGIALVLGPSAVRASHNTVTVGAPTLVFTGLTTWVANSTVRINNTTANAQSGQVTLYLFLVQFDGKVVQLQKQDLGPVTIPGGPGAAATPIPFSVQVHQPGTYLLLADVATTGVAHTHSGTITFIVN
jgi:hypothetical protein